MITIVTAASSNHYKSAKQFLRSCVNTYAYVIFYDIGLTEKEVRNLQSEFPYVIYRKLDWSKLPDFAHLSQPHAGAYAWKPYIIHEVYNECKEGEMIWCDAGNVITDLHELQNVTRQFGIYSPRSSFAVFEMTHEDCLQEMKVPQKYWYNIMRNAALVGFCCGDKLIATFIDQWKEYAMRKEIIIPKRSTRANHRWDQSILTCLMYMWDVRSPLEIIGAKIHQDCD
jgi:hypothetical protein